ncbi:ornithine decarboxylase antizyme-domain-containing protein [Suillus fuscotomentosus]|uniref:Ornithine decarboxylase antizyme n=1 Tax=Suillus fuscotomentosus TaxID=1912939 RepID=A0AAD4E6W7_9AGAM|nr:ornithine decarboxylase antizyme-domain-containing protein [Suillus fuscotomentosus]KAG1900680.1 ornithine decarboxylase antizyme-domain-containing protein [Suillus fuscotomentosus]
MSNPSMSNFLKQQFSICPANGCQAVGDGAFSADITPSVLAVCHMQGTDDVYYYSTTFSGGPGVRSSDCVTGSPASSISSSFSNYSSSPNTSNVSLMHPSYSPYSSTVPPRDIPVRTDSPYDIATPPLTPDDDEDSYATGILTKHSKDALDLLLAIFPRDGLSLLPFAKSVVVAAPNMGASFDGVVLELPGKTKTLYVDGKNAQAVSLRESIVALLDLADEQLQCSALIIAFNKFSHGLSELLHSLMYVGGSVVTKPPFQVDPTYILVGVEI